MNIKLDKDFLVKCEQINRLNIDISNQNINEINENTFSQLKHLARLDMSKNKIRENNFKLF